MQQLQSMKITIIDDDLMSIELMRSILEENGFTDIRAFSSAPEALEAIQAHRPDLVLLDIVMPEMDGFTFCKCLREKEPMRHLPVIMISGAGLEADETIRKTFEVGSTDFIFKPIRAVDFLARVRSALTLKQAYDGMEAELVKRREAEKEQQRLIEELRAALAKVKTLSGFLPICSACKKIRDDKGYWKQIENYICEHSEAEFSHSICPECARKRYPEFNLYGETAKPAGG
ncbi:MAG: response regulator [Thermodesulfobacteriota bacterium]